MTTGLCMDALMGAGATRATLWLNLGWAAVLFPALWFATKAGAIHGAALAQTGVGVLVAVPLTAVALRKSNVALRPLVLALIRPLAAGVLAGAAAWTAVHFTGDTYPFFKLLIGGVVGLLVYVPAAISRDQMREWVALIRRRPAAV